MVVRGIYSEAEEQMLAEYREGSDKFVGWVGETVSSEVPYPVFHRVASQDLIRHMACAADKRNPLWQDESYAKNTRWGGIIAPPFFQHCITHGGPSYPMKMPPGTGVAIPAFGGEYWEFFKPVRLNDSFKVWAGRPTLEDITPEGGNAPRRLRIISNISFINQKDELTCIFHRHIFVTVLPAGAKMGTSPKKSTEEYVYAEGEIAAIDHVFDSEEIRGAEPRYWEDVAVGDELKPVVQGPITLWDSIVEIQGFGLGIVSSRDIRRLTPEKIIVDPNTNLPLKSIEIHLSDRAAKILHMPSTTIIGVMTEHLMGRLVTNWMGDDGFLRRLDWLTMDETPIGDTIFGRGKVNRKYVDDNGDYLVDIDIWVESIRGNVSDVATATVNLVSREQVFK